MTLLAVAISCLCVVAAAWAMSGVFVAWWIFSHFEQDEEDAE